MHSYLYVFMYFVNFFGGQWSQNLLQFQFCSFNGYKVYNIFNIYFFILFSMGRIVIFDIFSLVVMILNDFKLIYLDPLTNFIFLLPRAPIWLSTALVFI